MDIVLGSILAFAFLYLGCCSVFWLCERSLVMRTAVSATAQHTQHIPLHSPRTHITTAAYMRTPHPHGCFPPNQTAIESMEAKTNKSDKRARRQRDRVRGCSYHLSQSACHSRQKKLTTPVPPTGVEEETDRSATHTSGGQASLTHQKGKPKQHTPHISNSVKSAVGGQVHAGTS